MFLLQSTNFKSTTEFSGNHISILKISFVSLNILKAAYKKQPATTNKKVKKKKSCPKTSFCAGPLENQTSHRKFVENQYVVVEILQLVQLIQHTTRVKGEEGRVFSRLCSVVSVLFPTSRFHRTCKCMANHCALLCHAQQGPAGHRTQAEGRVPHILEKEGIGCLCANGVI